jgi:hypothetical protein
MTSIRLWWYIKDFAALLSLMISLSLIRNLFLPLMLNGQHRKNISELISNADLRSLSLYHTGIGVNQPRAIPGLRHTLSVPINFGTIQRCH